MCLLFSAAMLCHAGCKSNGKKTDAPTKAPNRAEYMDESVVTIDGNGVGYREAMLYLESAKREYENAYGKGVWQYALEADGTTLGEWVKEHTLEQMIYIKIICAQAKKLGIELDSEEKSYVAKRTEQYMERAEYNTLAMYGIARKDVEQVYTDTALAQKLYDSITLNIDTDISDAEAAQKHLQSLVLKNYHEDETGGRTSLTVQELIAILDRFDHLYQEATETDDFYSLAYANTEDKEYLDITVGKGDLPTELSAAYDLKNGEALQIRTDNGYYLFYCVSEYDEDATIAKKEEMIAARQEAAFRDLYESWKTECKVELNEELWETMGQDLAAEN